MDVNDLIVEFQHIVSLTLVRRKNFVKKMGTTIREESKIRLSTEKPRGFGHFLEISEDISVYVLDVETDETIRLISVPSQQDFWVINYQIQCDINEQNINQVNGGSCEQVFTMIDSQHKGNLVCEKGLRMFSLRLFVGKPYFENPDLGIDLKKIFREDHFYSGVIDDKSLSIIKELMQVGYNQCSFDAVLKPVVYNLVALLIERLKSADLEQFIVSDH